MIKERPLFLKGSTRRPTTEVSDSELSDFELTEEVIDSGSNIRDVRNKQNNVEELNQAEEIAVPQVPAAEGARRQCRRPDRYGDWEDRETEDD